MENVVMYGGSTGTRRIHLLVEKNYFAPVLVEWLAEMPQENSIRIMVSLLTAVEDVLRSFIDNAETCDVGKLISQCKTLVAVKMLRECLSGSEIDFNSCLVSLGDWLNIKGITVVPAACEFAGKIVDGSPVLSIKLSDIRLGQVANVGMCVKILEYVTNKLLEMASLWTDSRQPLYVWLSAVAHVISCELAYLVECGTPMDKEWYYSSLVNACEVLGVGLSYKSESWPQIWISRRLRVA